jgi:hypothetical protein
MRALTRKLGDSCIAASVTTQRPSMLREFPQQATNASLIHADLLKRLKQRVIRNRILSAFGAFCPRLPEVGSFVENDDVAALSTLQK